MDKIEQIDKNSNQYEEYLYVINKDIERIMIYISYFSDYQKYILLSKFDQLQRIILNKIESNPTNYENDNIIISNDYVVLNFFNNQELIEIDDNTDVVIDNETIVLIKRNMKEFYFCNRKVLYELNEGDFVSKKIKSTWNSKHYEIKNKNIFFDEKKFDIDELIEQKIYLKGSKK